MTTTEDHAIPDKVERLLLRTFCRVYTQQQAFNSGLSCSKCGALPTCELQVFPIHDQMRRVLGYYCGEHCKDAQEFVLQNTEDFVVSLDGSDRHEFDLKVPTNQPRYDFSLKARLQAMKESVIRSEMSHIKDIVDELVQYHKGYNYTILLNKGDKYPLLAKEVEFRREP